MKRFLIFLLAPVLLAILLAYFSFNQKAVRTKESAIRKVSDNLSREFELLSYEAALIRRDSSFAWSSLKNTFYLLDSATLLKWSQHDLAMAPSELLQVEDLSIYTLSRSTLIVRKWSMEHEKTLIGIIPLLIDHRINNQFIQPWLNNKIFPEGVTYLGSADSSDSQICFSGKCLFSVSLVPETTNSFLFLLACSFCISLVFLIFWVAHYWHSRNQFFVAFLSLFGLLALLRISMVEWAFPSRWSKSDYFNPSFFASSSFNSSLADFFLNALIVAISCGYLFSVH